MTDTPQSSGAARARDRAEGANPAGLPADRPASDESASGKQPIRVMIVVDDHESVRGVAGALLAAPDIEVVGEADDGLQAISRAGQLLPDVIVMDSRVGVVGGVEATRLITVAFPSTRVVGLSAGGDARAAPAMLGAGAAACLARTAPGEEVLAAVRSCAPARPERGAR